MASVKIVFMYFIIVICVILNVFARTTLSPEILKEPLAIQSDDYPILHTNGAETFPPTTDVKDVLTKIVASVLGNNDTYFIKRIEKYEGAGPLTKVKDWKLDKPTILKRIRRSSRTHAGYTENIDTCQLYNDNLDKLWNNLTKYFNLIKKPESKALHNIALILGAYLEHQFRPIIHQEEKHEPENVLSEVLAYVKELLDTNATSATYIKNLVLLNLKPDYKSIIDTECKNNNEKMLSLAIELSYRNYMKDIDCKDDDSKEPSSKDLNMRTNGTLNCFSRINSTDNAKENRKKERIQCIANRLIQKMNSEKNSFFNKRLRSTIVTQNIRKSSVKTEKECVKFAKRLFITSLTSIIDRFMTLLDCTRDRTERSLDHLKSSYKDNLLHHLRKHQEKRARSERKKFKSFKHSENHRPDNETIKHRSNSNRIKDRSSNILNNNIEITNVVSENYNIENNDKNANIDRYSDNESSENILISNYFNVTKKVNRKYKPSNEIDKKSLMESDNHNQSRTKIDMPLYYEEFIKYFQHKYNQQLEAIKTSLITNFNITKNNNSTSASHQPYYYSNEANISAIDKNVSETLLENSRQYSDEMESDLYKSSTLKSNVSINEKNNTIATADVDNFEGTSNMTNKNDNSDGYIEITHLVKIPKVLIDGPFIMQHLMPYKKFLEIVNFPNFNSEDMELLKIIRHLSDNTTKILFESLASHSENEEVVKINSITKNNNMLDLYGAEDITKK